MKTRFAIVMACALLGGGVALAAEEVPACANETGGQGLQARVKTIRDQMDRIRQTTNREEQRRLIELHAKNMNEGLQETRRRQPGPGCRLEMMHAMMEQMIQHQQAVQESVEP